MKKSPEYDKYIKSVRWRNICDLMKKQAKYRYSHCGYGGHSSAILEVHHLTYESFGHEDMKDLLVLCKPCHELADKKREQDREADWENERCESAYHTYMTKIYGEEYYHLDSYETREKFDEWLRKKEESENDYY